MSMFGANRNRGGHNNHLPMEPGYGGPKPAVYGYAASQERYVASTEQVVQYGSPTRMELHKVQLPGIGENPLLRRVFGQQTHYDGASRDDHRSSPPTHGSPDHNKFHSPTRDHHYGKYKNYGSDGSDDDREKDVICRDGVCYPKPKNMRDEDYERERNGYNHTSPHPISHPKKDPYGHETSYNPPSYTVPVSVQTKKDNYPSRHTGSKPSFQQDNPHDNYPSRHTGSKPSFQQDKPHDNYPSRHTGSKPSFQQDNPHDNYPSHHTGSRPSFPENNPHNSYASPPYAISTHPKKDAYPRDGYYEKPKGGSYSPPSYAAQPRKDHSNHDATSRPMMYNNPLAPIKTKPEHGVYHDGGASSPKSPFSPSKEHQETIDSVEARRRYGKVSSPMGQAHVEKHTGVIDSQEAARKYKGIFVNY